MASKANEVSELTDQIIQDVVGRSNRLRIDRIEVSYSLLSNDLDSIKRKLENNGFAVRINSQLQSTYHITAIYLRNWGGEV